MINKLVCAFTHVHKSKLFCWYTTLTLFFFLHRFYSQSTPDSWSTLWNHLNSSEANCQGTLRHFHPFHPFCLFHPLDNFITFPSLYSTPPSLSNTPSFSVNFHVLPLFHFYFTFHFPSSFYSLLFYSLSSCSLFFPSLFLSRVPLFSV